MISLSTYKKLLGEEAQGLTDEEVERIRDEQFRWARFAFDKWAREKRLNKANAGK